MLSVSAISFAFSNYAIAPLVSFHVPYLCGQHLLIQSKFKFMNIAFVSVFAFVSVNVFGFVFVDV